MSESHHLKFTQVAVERLSPPTSGRIVYWDSLLPGFGLRIGALIEDERLGNPTSSLLKCPV
jgi:hypothetical protein